MYLLFQARVINAVPPTRMTDLQYLKTSCENNVCMFRIIIKQVINMDASDWISRIKIGIRFFLFHSTFSMHAHSHRCSFMRSNIHAQTRILTHPYTHTLTHALFLKHTHSHTYSLVLFSSPPHTHMLSLSPPPPPPSLMLQETIRTSWSLSCIKWSSLDSTSCQPYIIVF